MFISANGAQLFATRYGAQDAQAIVGIGGWIGSSELWTDPFTSLSQHWQTIAYDHRGSGASIAATPSITYENLVADLFAVLDNFGLGRSVVAAESAGALTAIGAALAHPERISHLVIVDGMYYRGVPPDQDPFLKGLQAAYGPTLERFIQLCVPELDCEHIKAWGRQIIARALPEAAIALRLLGSELDIRSELSRITQPTLVIHGDQDKIVPLERAKELAAAIPSAELLVLEGAGHVPTLTRPGQVADAIASFLRRFP